MEVHIGSIIQGRAKEMRMGPTELGAKIETSKQNVYGIFKRSSIDTALLHRISIALSHDFFQYLSNNLRLDAASNEGAPSVESETHGALDLQQRIAAEENVYLRRLNALLEEKLQSMLVAQGK